MLPARRCALGVAAVAVLALAACTSDADDGPSGSASGELPTAAATTATAGGATATTRAPASSTTSAPSSAAGSGAVTRSPVAISSPADFGGGVTARIARVRSVRVTARLPGEVNGPAVAVTIRVANASRRAVALVPVVNLYYGPRRTPAAPIEGSMSSPFAARIAAGATGTGTYTFTLGTGQRSRVRVEFSYTPTAPVVLWEGSVS